MLDTRASASRAAAGSHRIRPLAADALRRLAQLLALTAFAIAQPILDVTGRAPDFFLYRRANTNEMRLFLVLVVLLPPLALWAVELVVGLVNRVAMRVVHLAFVAILFALVLIQVGKKIGPVTGLPLAFLALLGGAGLSVLLVRKPPFRQAVNYAAPAPLLFALLFTTTTPSGALVLGTDAKTGAGRIVPNRPPIVYLFLDEFPLRALLDDKGTIDAKLYPNFARLQKMSNWYPNATGVTGWTPFAAPAMLRGAYPPKAQAASYINYPETLFTLLAQTYRLHAYETIAELCPPGMCVDVASGRGVGMRALTNDTIGLAGEIVSPYKSSRNVTEQFVEDAVEVAKEAAKGKKKPGAQDLFGRVALNQPKRFGPFLEDLVPKPEPHLHFMHLLMPHAPYRYLPSGNQYRGSPTAWLTEPADPTRPKGVTPDDPLWSVIVKQRLLLQTVYTDSLLGTMLNRLEKTGLLDQALLVVAADHGTGIEPRSKLRTLDAKNPADLAWVPMFVKTPGQKKGTVDQRNATGVDLVPTIADVLDVTIPWKIDGVSLLGKPRTASEKFWTDNPNGKGLTIDPAKWRAKVAKGYASEIAQPRFGPSGLYMVGPLGGLVGKKVSELTVGSPSPIRATMHGNTDLDDADPADGSVPAMLLGDLDRPAGAGPTWLVAAVNGTIAGAIAAMPSDGNWKFAGLVDDRYFAKGEANVELFAVEGTTLHRLRLDT